MLSLFQSPVDKFMFHYHNTSRQNISIAQQYKSQCIAAKYIKVLTKSFEIIL